MMKKVLDGQRGPMPVVTVNSKQDVTMEFEVAGTMLNLVVRCAANGEIFVKIPSGVDHGRTNS